MPDSQSAEYFVKIEEDSHFYQSRESWSQNERFCPNALTILQIPNLQI